MSQLSEIPTADLLREIAGRISRASAPYVLDPTERGELIQAWGAQIVREVASSFGVSVSHIMGRVRSERIAKARQVAMAGLWQLGFSSPEVGKFFSRDHATILHAIKRTRAARPIS